MTAWRQAIFGDIWSNVCPPPTSMPSFCVTGSLRFRTALVCLAPTHTALHVAARPVLLFYPDLACQSCAPWLHGSAGYLVLACRHTLARAVRVRAFPWCSTAFLCAAARGPAEREYLCRCIGGVDTVLVIPVIVSWFIW